MSTMFQRRRWTTTSTSPMTTVPHFYHHQQHHHEEEEEEEPPEEVPLVLRRRSDTPGTFRERRHGSPSAPSVPLSPSGFDARPPTLLASSFPPFFSSIEDTTSTGLQDDPGLGARNESGHFGSSSFRAGTARTQNMSSSFMSTKGVEMMPEKPAAGPWGTSKTTDDKDEVEAKVDLSKADDYYRPEGQQHSMGVNVMFGVINATIVLPVLMSFTSIIYREPVFSPYMPVLVKLTIVSGMVHQLCFSTLSSLPFAVGQVQDAGLIFLSAMATFLVEYTRIHNQTQQPHEEEQRPEDAKIMLATVTVGLSLATVVLGVGLLLIGRLGLAQFVQMLPTCVVGGYLAFIGWFCGLAGLGLMAGASHVTLSILWSHVHLILPGVAGGLLMYTAARTLRHMAVLPVCIVMLFLVFYLTLWLTDTSLAEATARGWIRPTDPPPVWYHTWDYLQINKVMWSAFPRLITTELGMILVVALSSSLDVAAIELELNRPLNYNHELKMIGLSNLVSGLTGGYTGSYIFSQSIFTLRAGIRSRWTGYTTACCQGLMLILPFPILAYVPNFFFGSLLTMISVDLMYEWLWEVRTRVEPLEYVICLATFVGIQCLGVEFGILAGTALYFLCQKIGLDVGQFKIATLESEAADAMIRPEGSAMECEPLHATPGQEKIFTSYGAV